MSFKGDLSTIGLAEVFQMISMSQKEGTLVVVDTDSRKSIYFGSSGIRLLSTGKRKGQRLGDMLVRAGKLDDERLQEALENAKIQKKRIGETLVESGLVAETDIEQVVREQIEEEIYDLFLWKRADFEFVEGPPADDLNDPDMPVTKLSFDVNGLLLEAVRRADEWSVINQKLPSLDSVFAFASEADRAEEEKTAPDVLRRVYRMIDGRRTVLEIVEATGVGKFDACKGLLDLQERGRVRLLDVREMMDLATARMNAGEKDAALRMFIAAAAQAGKDAKIVAGVARVLENEGMARDAAAHHSRASTIYLESNELDRALDHAQSALNLQPDDPAIKMSMFEVHAALGNLEEGKRLAKELATQSLIAPDYVLTRSLCDRILHVDPTDLDFRILRAKALLRSGERIPAEADVDFIRKHMPGEAREAERIERELREFTARPPTAAVPRTTTQAKAPLAPKAGSSWRWVKAAAILLLLLGGGAAAYEVMSRKELAKAVAASDELARKSQYDEARAPLEAFVKGPYRFSPGQRERAEALLAELSNRRKVLDKENMDRDLAKKAETRERISRLLASAREARTREPAQALAKARSVREQADAAGEAELRAAADGLIAEIEKYVADAQQLKAKADELENDGKVREAALLIERLKAEYPNTDVALGALYPLEILTRPSDVRITNMVSNQSLGESKGGRFVHRMRAGETVRLLFEKPGWGFVERTVKEKTIGRLSVELTEKKIVWSKPLGVRPSGEPALAGDTLYLSDDSRVYALRLDPFALLWFETLDGAVSGAPKAGKNRIYAGTQSGEVVAIDPARRDGRVAERRKLDERVSATPGLSMDESLVFVATGDRQLRALRAEDLEEVWRRELPAEARLEPVMAGGLLVVACSDGTVLGLKVNSGDEVWQLRADGPLGPMSVAGTEIYAGSSDQHVYAIDAVSGRRLWRRLLPALPTGRAVRANDVVLSSARDGKVYVLAASTGAPQTVVPTDGPILGGVAVAGSLALFGSDDGCFYAYDLEMRSPWWKLKTPGRIRQPGVVVGGRVYFGGDDSLFAVDLE